MKNMNNDYFNRLMKEMIKSEIYKSTKCIYKTANRFDEYQIGAEQDSECTYNYVISICDGNDILTNDNLPTEWKSA